MDFSLHQVTLMHQSCVMSKRRKLKKGGHRKGTFLPVTRRSFLHRLCFYECPVRRSSFCQHKSAECLNSWGSATTRKALALSPSYFTLCYRGLAKTPPAAALLGGPSVPVGCQPKAHVRGSQHATKSCKTNELCLVNVH